MVVKGVDLGLVLPVFQNRPLVQAGLLALRERDALGAQVAAVQQFVANLTTGRCTPAREQRGDDDDQIGAQKPPSSGSMLLHPDCDPRLGAYSQTQSIQAAACWSVCSTGRSLAG